MKMYSMIKLTVMLTVVLLENHILSPLGLTTAASVADVKMRNKNTGQGYLIKHQKTLQIKMR